MGDGDTQIGLGLGDIGMILGRLAWEDWGKIGLGRRGDIGKIGLGDGDIHLGVTLPSKRAIVTVFTQTKVCYTLGHALPV